jgi:hypothetical protein
MDFLLLCVARHIFLVYTTESIGTGRVKTSADERRATSEELWLLLLWRNIFYLWMILVGNLVFGWKRTFGGRKRILRLPRTIPLAILLVEILLFKIINIDYIHIELCPAVCWFGGPSICPALRWALLGRATTPVAAVAGLTLCGSDDGRKSRAAPSEVGATLVGWMFLRGRRHAASATGGFACSGAGAAVERMEVVALSGEQCSASAVVFSIRRLTDTASTGPGRRPASRRQRAHRSSGRGGNAGVSNWQSSGIWDYYWKSSQRRCRLHPQASATMICSWQHRSRACCTALPGNTTSGSIHIPFVPFTL